MGTHYITAGYGDSATWPQYSGHPNDPRRDIEAEEAEIASQADKIHRELALSAKAEKPTDRQLAVADRLIRYLDDSDVVDLINGVFAKDKSRVFASVEALIDNAVNDLVEYEHED